MYFSRIISPSNSSTAKQQQVTRCTVCDCLCVLFNIHTSSLMTGDWFVSRDVYFIEVHDRLQWHLPSCFIFMRAIKRKHYSLLSAFDRKTQTNRQIDRRESCQQRGQTLRSVPMISHRGNSRWFPIFMFIEKQKSQISCR